MSNLVPVRRTDKNGVLTTKHVRADAKKTTATKLPPVALPATSPARQAKDDERARTKRIRQMGMRGLNGYSRSEYNIQASSNLSHLFSERYAISVSDNDAYGLFEKMSLSDAIVLASNNVDPAGLSPKTLTFVNQEDNSVLVSQLMERGVRFSDYVSVALRYSSSGYEQKNLIDAAECLSLYPGKNMDDTFGPKQVYSNYLLQGQMNLTDLKEIGVDYCADTNAFAILLLKMNKGTSKCTAAELGTMLDRTKKTDHSKELRQYEINSIISARAALAVVYGADVAERMHNPVYVDYVLSESPSTTERTPEENLSFCEFINKSRPAPYSGNQEEWPRSILQLNELWERGVDPEKVRSGMDARLTTSQIIAIHTEGIAPSVAGGWL